MKDPHIPVMLQEVLQLLQPKTGETYIDATFGAGGYSKAIMEAADCTLYAVDRDPNALKFVASFDPKKFKLIQGNFGDLEQLAEQNQIQNIQAIIFDLGVSSIQLDTAERGFSFNLESKLDMRMSQEGMSAYELVNSASEEELADIIYLFGGEHKARKIAYRIVKKREIAPITTTIELANIVRSVVRAKYGKIDPATKTFQAIRIAINDELTELKNGLIAAEKLLTVGGRLIVVSFHSLEDSIVKNFFNQKSGKLPGVSRYLPDPDISTIQASLKILTNKALTPTAEEEDANQRSRSAKLRAAVKL